MMHTINNRIMMFAIGMYLIMTAGCGGGGSATTTATATAIQQPTSATISYYFSNSSISPLVGLQFNVYLPAGVTVATDQGTKNVTATSLIPGSALSGQLIQGTYSSPILKVAITTNPIPMGKTEILKLNCGLASGKNYTLDTFKAVNNSMPIPQSNLVGYSYNLAAQPAGLVDITSSLTPSFTVAFSSYSASR
jgi:hypothetical protein